MNQPIEEPYLDEKIKAKVKKIPPRVVIAIASFVMVAVFALVALALILANKEVQEDYNHQCADICYDDGRYIYSDKMCTCFDVDDHATNYFIANGEFVQVGVEQNK